MTTDTDRAALTTLAVLPADEIERLPWLPVPTCPGVEEKTLWQFGDFVQALVRYAPGSSSPSRSWRTPQAKRNATVPRATA